MKIRTKMGVLLFCMAFFPPLIVMAIVYVYLQDIFSLHQDLIIVLAPALFLSGALGQGLVLLLAFHVSKKATSPLVNISQAASQIASGDYSAKISDCYRKDEIGTLARAFNSMTIKLVSLNRSLAENNRKKSEFVGLVSHEFCNPLIIISQAAESVLEENERLTEDQIKMLGMISRNSVRLTRLVHDLLDLTKIESGKMELHVVQVDLKKSLQECLEDMQKLIENRNIVVRSHFYGKEFMVLGDEDRMKEVFDNLLSNAVKYTPSGGRIEVRLDDFNEEVYFRVSNTGQGLSDEDCKNIFNKYVRVCREKQSGTGLGLPIVKDIIALHAGDVTVQSKKGEETTFTVVLPKDFRVHHAGETHQAA